MTNKLGIINAKPIGNFEKKSIQDLMLTPQTAAAFHSKLVSHRLVLKETPSVAPKWLLRSQQ